MEELFKELSKFTRENRKALKLAEQWLNEFDGDLEDAWEVAKNELPIDWKKIVFIAWFASDEKIYECKFIDEGFNVHQWCPKKKDGRNPQIDFLHDVIFGVGYSYNTRKNPCLYLIQNALEAGRKAVAGSLNDTSNIVLPDKEQRVLEELAGHQGEALTIRMLSKTLRTPESTTLDRVNRLRKKGLADKIEGRRGFFATDTGIEWYKRRWGE